ncbi:hypothetical protein Lalb_Chr01g0006741 [Lupinus albus]|uniref:Uncharacterized protein n=1 Tax=Lupinus albus TaxID=3870 RepID=A0A6A4R400_LUPAL|nr:hypothetical protein Lalb_Chr01g0006741 [Lupinus albus]
MSIKLYEISHAFRKIKKYCMPLLSSSFQQKRIQDAFSWKRRFVKEYEQLAICYGDADSEHGRGLSRTLLPFRSRTCEDSKNLQGHDASESDWELL